MDATNRPRLDAALRQRLREQISEARRREAGVELDHDQPTPVELRDLRRRAGIRNKEAAKRLGVSPAHIGFLEGSNSSTWKETRGRSEATRELVDRYVTLLRHVVETKESTGITPEPLAIRELTRWRYEVELMHRQAEREGATARG